MPETRPVIDETHDPALRSFVEQANDPASDFPIQNLPLCAFFHPEEEVPALGVRIGDSIVDLALLSEAGILTDKHGHDHDDQSDPDQPDEPEGSEHPHHEHDVFSEAFANHLMGHGVSLRRSMRRELSEFLRDGPAGGQQRRRLREKSLLPVSEVELLIPAAVMNYTDFYASVHHATTVGSMFRPDNPLLPNYKHVPIGYHGRASSVVASGTPVVRPRGQQAPPDDKPQQGPSFGPSTMLDYELEVGLFVGPGNELGTPVSVRDARQHIWGLCLVNDWSARDLQKWEYQPLGPFLAKNFATSVSPYIVTLDALEPFRVPAFRRPAGDPAPLPYLLDDTDQALGAFDITLQVLIQSQQMRERSMPPMVISTSNAFRDLYWTLAQLVAHHTVNGCNLQSGDLLASGTVSGEAQDTRGCLLERTWAGRGPDAKPLPRTPILLPTGEKRVFLDDGDEVILRGWCQREGFRRIGFGECRGVIESAPR